MKNKLFSISLIACISFALCRGQNQSNTDKNILYIIDQDGKKLHTDHLIILPKDIEHLTVISKQDSVQYYDTSKYDVILEVRPKSNVSLLSLQMLLDTFKIKRGAENIPIRVDDKLLSDAEEMLTEYAAISKIELNEMSHRIEITTRLTHLKNNSSEPPIR
jgi:hypothetical protein